VCSACFLVQVPHSVAPEEIFSEYAYFSSYSDSWLAHASDYVEVAARRFRLDERSLVVELASNDGYLLRNFVERGIPCLGIEPARNVAESARRLGVPTLVEFFDDGLARRLAARGTLADLVIGNNVLAQVPAVHDFVSGIARLLKPDGVLTLEFPHLLRLVEGNQFDTIYHEHFFYFSLLTVRNILGCHGLRVFDVEELRTHGGSLRVYACLETSAAHEVTGRVTAIEEIERAWGVGRLERYATFQERVAEVKRSILEFLIDARRGGHHIVAYGAPGKGNTLLNYCGIRTDFIDYAVDRSPVKQGLYTPGTHIPILAPERMRETRPAFVVVMPWNLRDEIVAQHRYIAEWGGRFVIFLPDVQIERSGDWSRA
jgi:SAM-dependent methyltransferase